MHTKRTPLGDAYRVLLRRWMMSSAWDYYRKIEIKNGKDFPVGQLPLVFAGNHQNSFMDALLMIYSCGTVPVFLTRADIFKSRLAARVLGSFRMMPIYRQRDGKDSMKKNEVVFDQCVSWLAQRDSLGIFPEGSHGRDPYLRPLKKGMARIVMVAEERNDFKLGVQVIPVGINYSAHTERDSDVFIYYGEPMDITQFYDAYQKDPVRAFVLITNALKENMRPLLIDITDRAYREDINFLRIAFGDGFLLEARPAEGPLARLFRTQKALVAKVEAYLKQHPEEGADLMQATRTYREELEGVGVSDAGIRPGAFGRAELWAGRALLLLGFPIYAYGWLNHLILDYLGKRARGNFKDDHFHSSVEMLSLMASKPLVYALQTGLVWGISGNGWIALAYLLSLPLVRWIARAYQRHWKKVNEMAAVLKLKRKGLLDSLQTHRAAIVERLQMLMKASASMDAPAT